MNRLGFYAIILLVLVAIYMFSANTSIFKKPKNKESFQDDDDADDKTDIPESRVVPDDRTCKGETCPLDKSAEVIPPKASNVISIYESFQSDIAEIKEDLTFIKKHLTKKAQPMSFDAFYAAGYN